MTAKDWHKCPKCGCTSWSVIDVLCIDWIGVEIKSHIEIKCDKCGTSVTVSGEYEVEFPED